MILCVDLENNEIVAFATAVKSVFEVPAGKAPTAVFRVHRPATTVERRILEFLKDIKTWCFISFQLCVQHSFATILPVVTFTRIRSPKTCWSSSRITQKLFGKTPPKFKDLKNHTKQTYHGVPSHLYHR
jgi:hypothetical protein